ncbi:putative kinase [Stella humosa]|uniref:Putative kinase n=1 Tax=Stella humosa TaxID=94 RepID=A0A3N1MDS3_9PROT|nr:ATP-binding protein [Stella humosa]ROQ01881.1 putative kinase [Stella humosa]BBK32270.1 cell division protein ZipA [Stella humosa]
MATLFMVCGKIATGKSTLAAQLADRSGTILVSQDRLMSRLYPDEIRSIEDYARVSPRLRDAMGDHLASILRAGVSVVLDWPANTVLVRHWMRSVFEAGAADHELHVVHVDMAERRRRLMVRNAAGGHEYQVDDETLALFDRHFEEPGPAEGFHLVLHD